jgi:hypothetical protein
MEGPSKGKAVLEVIYEFLYGSDVPIFVRVRDQ